MTPLRPLRALHEGLTDDSLRFAILVGLATVPFTLALSWEPVPVTDEGVVLGGSIAGGPLLLAGLLVGYRYRGRATESRRAGIWTGLVGSIATVPVYGANAVATISSASPEMAVAAVFLTLIALGIGVGLSVLVTTVCAVGCDWVLTRLDRRGRRRDPTADERGDATDPKWRYAITAYVLAAPAVLYYALWVMPDGVGFAVSVLGLFVLVPLSVVVLVGLFVDVTAPRDRESEWIPSVRAYVGVPIGTYVLVYAVATLRGSINPAGDAVYGFMGVLWLASLVYLLNRYRHDGGRDSQWGLPI